MEKVALAMETTQNLYITAKQSPPTAESYPEINYPIMSISQAQILNDVLEKFKVNHVLC